LVESEEASAPCAGTLVRAVTKIAKKTSRIRSIGKPFNIRYQNY
jgi:ribonucleotide monophosphatase NagD (HAD superfamily)